MIGPALGRASGFDRFPRRSAPPTPLMEPDMSTKIRILFAASILTCTAAAFAAGALSHAGDGQAPQEGLSEEEMMAKMMELATPGAEHAALTKRVGSWTHDFKMRMSPDQPWMETPGSSEVSALLGGRFVLEKVSMNLMGMPFEGLQINGYDKLKGEYTSLWMDSMSTWAITSRGKADDKGVVELKGTMIDVAGERAFRSVVTPKGDDELMVEMYDTIPSKGEVLMMSYTSKRKK